MAAQFHRSTHGRFRNSNNKETTAGTEINTRETRDHLDIAHRRPLIIIFIFYFLDFVAS